MSKTDNRVNRQWRDINNLLRPKSRGTSDQSESSTFDTSSEIKLEPSHICCLEFAALPDMRRLQVRIHRGQSKRSLEGRVGIGGSYLCRACLRACSTLADFTPIKIKPRAVELQDFGNFIVRFSAPYGCALSFQLWQTCRSSSATTRMPTHNCCG